MFWFKIYWSDTIKFLFLMLGDPFKVNFTALKIVALRLLTITKLMPCWHDLLICYQITFITSPLFHSDINLSLMQKVKQFHASTKWALIISLISIIHSPFCFIASGSQKGISFYSYMPWYKKKFLVNKHIV